MLATSPPARLASPSIRVTVIVPTFVSTCVPLIENRNVEFGITLGSCVSTRHAVFAVKSYTMSDGTEMLPTMGGPVFLDLTGPSRTRVFVNALLEM